MTEGKLQVLIVGDGEVGAQRTAGTETPDLLAGNDLRFQHLPFQQVEAARTTLHPELVMLELGDLPDDEAVRRTALLSRTWPFAPLVTRGSQSGTGLLALLAAGAADHVPRHADGEEVRARLLVAQERKLTERELRRGYASFQNLFQTADVGIALANPQGRFLEANPAFYELLGYTPETLPLRSIEDLTYPEDRRFLHLFWELAAARRDRYEVRKRYVKADGSVIWLEVHASRIQDPSAGERCLIAEFHDLTPFLRTREALDETRAQYQILFERNPVPTLVVDSGPSRILAANQAALDTYGYPLGDMLDLPLRRLWYRDEGFPGDLASRLQSDAAERPVRAHHRRRDGTQLVVEIHAVGLEYGHRPALLLLVHDLTRSLRLESELQSVRREVEVRQKRELGRRLDKLVRSLRRQGEELLRSVESGEAGDAANVARRLRGMVDLGLRASELTARLAPPAPPAPFTEPAGEEAGEGAGGGASEIAPLPDAVATGTTSATGASILLVDDDDAVRFLMREMLCTAGHRVTDFASAAEAWQAVEEKGVRFELVIADASLDDLPGSGLLERLRIDQPGLRLLLVSGYLDAALATGSKLGGEPPFLSKPFSAEELLSKVAETLAADAAG